MMEQIITFFKALFIDSVKGWLLLAFTLVVVYLVRLMWKEYRGSRPKGKRRSGPSDKEKRP